MNIKISNSNWAGVSAAGDEATPTPGKAAVSLGCG